MRGRFLLPVAFLGLLAIGLGVAPPASPAGVIEEAYSVQMHVHGCFSEGSGSIDSHTAESQRVGLDVLWWSEHDWRIEAHRHASRLSFDSLTEPIGRLEPWIPNTTSDTRVTKGVKLARKGMLGSDSGVIDATRSVEGTASLLLTATSTRTTFQDLEYALFANRSRFLRPLASGVTLDIAVHPDSVGPDAHAYVEVQLSLHPDPLAPARKPYRIRYELSPDGGSPARTAELYRVPMAVTAGNWNSLSLPITADAEAGFAPFDGADNVLHDIRVGLEVRRGATARAAFDDLWLAELVPPLERFALQAGMLLEKEAAVPEVAQIQGTEISLIGEHLNEFSTGTVLPDYEALFQESGLVDASGMIRNTTAMANFVSRRIVADVHARGGVVSYNHIFGTGTAATSATPTKEKALAKLQTNDLYGADILEVGYRQRGRSLADHLWVWDRLGLAGRFVIGTGVSDSHNGYPGEYDSTTNTFVSWIWAASRGADDLLAGLARGRVFFGDITRFDGTLELTSASGFRMGDIVVTSAESEDVTAALTGLEAGDRLQWIVSGVPAGAAVASGPDLTETRTIVLDPAGPTIVRVELREAGGRELAFGNPISFVRAAPLHALQRLVFQRTRR